MSCIRLKIILEMLAFHLDPLPDPDSSAMWESRACTTQACGLVATELCPTFQPGSESDRPWEGQTGAAHRSAVCLHLSSSWPCLQPWHQALAVQCSLSCACRHNEQETIHFWVMFIFRQHKESSEPWHQAGGERDPQCTAEGREGSRAAYTALDHH